MCYLLAHVYFGDIYFERFYYKTFKEAFVGSCEKVLEASQFLHIFWTFKIQLLGFRRFSYSFFFLLVNLFNFSDIEQFFGKPFI